MSKPLATVVVLLAVALVGIATAGCGFIENDRKPAAPIEDGVASGSTVPPPPETPIAAEDICALLSQADLDAAGIVAGLGESRDASGLHTLGTSTPTAACEWFVSDGAAFTLSVVVATGVGSETFETMLADPGAGDPFTVDGLGDMAAYVAERSGIRSDIGSNYVIVLDDGKLLRVDSLNSVVVDEEHLVALTRIILDKL